MIFGLLPPGRFAFVTLATKPEIVLQAVMYFFCLNLIRPEIVGLCLILNLWGLIVYFRQTSKIFGGKYEIMRADMLEATGDEVFVARVDKIAGYKPPTNEQRKGLNDDR